MCKTCMRPVSYEEEATVGPWGLSETYRSASLAFRRLRHQNEREEAGDSDTSSEERHPVRSKVNFVQTSDTNKQKSPERALINTHGGAPLAHTNRASRTYHTVGGGDGNGVIEEEDENSRSSSASSIIADTSRDAGRGRQHEIAHATDDSSKHGRKIGQVTIPSTGDAKLESTQQPPARPFFFLPSEDEDEGSATYADTIEQELLKDPDLYPFPKTGGGATPGNHHHHHISTSTTTATTSTSPSARPSKSPASPRSPLQQKAGEETDEIRNRIRFCLQRARSRSTSLCGLGSFEAGLYRLENLLDENKDPNGHQSLPPPTGYPRAEHAAVLMPRKFKDTGTITDVCTGDNVAEVELISLLEEQIPCYKLRADTYTEFSGYDNADWTVPFPALKEEDAEALSPEQAEGALAYFVLCGSRVSQMTKTYNDIDAVTRLLQEKEKDLELAAKIGQQLLSRNKALEERNSLLDAEVVSATEKITQLKHDLQMKTDLLAIYTNDVDDTSSCETTPTSVRLINMDILQHRVKNLEVENRSLRQEATKLATDTMECEDKEKELVTGVIKQLTDANLQVRQLSEELAKKVEDSLRQQEEITQLLAQVVDLQAQNKRLTCENDELASMVGVARECQQELTMELAELKEKYAEVLDLLHDTQDQLRRAQKKNLPGSRGHHLGSHGLFNSSYNSGNDSIASELHSLSFVSGEEEASSKASSNMRRTFDTVRLTGKHSHLGSSQGSLNSLGYGGSVHSTPTHLAGGTMSASYLGSRGSSVYSGGSGHPSLDSGADSDASVHTDSEDNYPGSHLGVPGWPGTPDLDSCLRRLGPSQDQRTPSHFLPYGCRTPDSIMSTGSGKSGLSAYGGGTSGADWKLPQKLQIVKPIEGSLTLHQWSRLATPHLGGLLEEREGVAIKGGTGTDLNLEVYSMSDLEEDEPEEENPGKQFMSTSGVFTFTNSTILHPDDQLNLTPSIRQSQVSVLPTSSASSHVPATPATPIRNPSLPPSRRGSTATFSVNTGLAKMLNERGTSKGDNFAPTATPANSPTASRPGSPEPEGYKLPGLEDLTKTFYYGASLLRRTFYKSDPSAPQSPTGPQVNLVEQVQAIGVDRFVGLSGSALTVGGVVTSRPATSPLLHLSNLIMSSAKSNSNTVTDSGKPHSSSSNTSFASTTLTSSGQSASGMIMSAPKLPSPGERRPTLPSGAPMGIPGHPGAGHLDTRLSQLKPGQRADLGTVGGRPRPTSLGTVPPRGSMAEPNVGTVGWTSFGRKGGLL